MIDSDLQETIALIKERHKIFLEKKVQEKEEEFKKTSYLDLAETKKDLKYLIKAKHIVTSSIEKITEKGIDLEYDDEVLNEVTLERYYKSDWGGLIVSSSGLSALVASLNCRSNIDKIDEIIADLKKNGY